MPLEWDDDEFEFDGFIPDLEDVDHEYPSTCESELDMERKRVRQANGCYAPPAYDRTCTFCSGVILAGARHFPHPKSRENICYDCKVLLADVRGDVLDSVPSPIPVREPSKIVPYWLHTRPAEVETEPSITPYWARKS